MYIMYIYVFTSALTVHIYEAFSAFEDQSPTLSSMIPNKTRQAFSDVCIVYIVSGTAKGKIFTFFMRKIVSIYHQYVKTMCDQYSYDTSVYYSSQISFFIDKGGRYDSHSNGSFCEQYESFHIPKEEYFMVITVDFLRDWEV